MKRPLLCTLCVGLGSIPLAQTFSTASIWGRRAVPAAAGRAAPTTSSWSNNKAWDTTGSDATTVVPVVVVAAAVTAATQDRRAAGRTRPSPVRPRTALGAAKIAVDVGDVKRGLSTAQERLENNRKLFDEARLAGELEYLEGVSSEADFWNDANAARKTLGDLNRWVWVWMWVCLCVGVSVCRCVGVLVCLCVCPVCAVCGSNLMVLRCYN